jgi:hypothetical protein
MQNTPARKILNYFFHAMRIECAEDVEALIGANENVNRGTLNRPVQGNLIPDLGLHKVILFGGIRGCAGAQFKTNEHERETNEGKNDFFHTVCDRWSFGFLEQV